MKKLVILLAVFASGCTAVDAYLLGKFDNNEYMQITEIRVDAHNAATDCTSPERSRFNAATMAYHTQIFESYAEKLPHNGDAYKSAQALNEIAQGLKTRYEGSEPVSTIFCKLKFEGIEHSADLMAHVLGKRPR